MAELDIKDIWAKGKLQRFNALTLDVDDVIGKKSKNVLYWVKFVLWIEFWINVVSLPIMIWSIFYVEFMPMQKTMTIITTGLVVVYLFYYQFLIRNIKAFDYTEDVYSSLKKIYGYLKFYLLHYRVIVWGVLPVIFGLTFYMSLDQLANEENITIVPGTAEFWLFLTIMSAFYLFIILIIHFLVNLIYGRKIKRLKGMIAELEN